MVMTGNSTLKKYMQFRSKLLLSYVLIIAVITGCFYFYFDQSLGKKMIEESRANLAIQSQLARLLVIRDKQVTSPQQLAELIGNVIKARITLITLTGTVIGDSVVERTKLEQMENHLQRSEVREALQNGSGSALRYSDTLKTTMLYSAIAYGSGISSGVIRLGVPLEYLDSSRDNLHGLIIGAALLTILIGILLSYVISKLMSEALTKNLQLEKLQNELVERIAELEATLARVNQLEGIIPICASCKKIRDEENSWHTLERFISARSTAEFSHALCPQCVDEQKKIFDTYLLEQKQVNASK